MEYRKHKLLPIIAFALAFAQDLSAQQPGSRVSIAFNLAGSSGDRTNGSSIRNYAGYPSVQLMSKREHAALEVSYSFGYDRNRGDLGRDSRSHDATTKLTVSLGPKLGLVVSETFDRTADLTTFNAARGVVLDQESVRYLFSPVAARVTSQTSMSGITLNYSHSAKSRFSTTGIYSILIYSGDSLVSGQLSRQNRTAGSVGYNRRMDERSDWSVSYSGASYAFTAFRGSRSHAVSFGYLRQLTPSVSLRLSGGPSYVEGETAARNYAGYNTGVTLQKVTKLTALSLRYTHESGISTGLGTLSDTDQAGLAVSRSVGSRVMLSSELLANRSSGTNRELQAIRGVTSVTTVGLSLSKTLSVNWGAQYQRQNQSAFGFQERRLFVSIGFRRPNLWRFSR